MPEDSPPPGPLGADHRPRQRWVLFFACLLAAAIAFAVAVVPAVVSEEHVATSVSGELASTGRVELRFDKPLRTTTSPVCGCVAKRPKGGWRGIVFPARQIVVRRRAPGAASHRYMLLGASSVLDWHARHGVNDRGLEFESRILELPSGTPPTLLEIEALAQLPPQEKARVDSAEVIARGPLHAASFGVEPVAAIGSPAGTTTTISFEAPVVRPGDPTLRVSTRSRSVPKSADAPAYREGALIDVLGPTVAIWTKVRPEKRASITYTHWRPTFEQFAENRRLLPYSADTSSVFAPKPFAGGALWQVITVKRGAFAVRIAPGPNVDPNDDQLARGERIEVTVPRVVSGAKQLLPAFRRARRSPYVKIRDVPYITPRNFLRSLSRLEGKWTKRWGLLDDVFQLPPTPPLSGVNVFGRFERLGFQAARGSLTLGPDRTLDLSAATPLAFRNIEGPGVVVGEHLIIPVRIDSRTAKVRIQGRAETLVNGDPYLTEQASWVRFLDADFVTVTAALVGVFLAASAFLVAGSPRGARGTPRSRR